MTQDFYRAFEDRYRGSRDLIKSRLSVYLPFVMPLLLHYPSGGAVDVGCGRGEWLEVVGNAGFRAVGVDLDAGMLQACRDLGLSAEQGDAISYLQALPDQSQVVVSAFHVVEHMGFDELRTLVAEALRVLVPGGVLIMETPNPENIIVATRNFYLDPTHQRPIPPDLLTFVPEHAGFFRVKALRLQESIELRDGDRISLQDVLEGASPDYAVVAQKQGSEALISALDPQFSRSFGLSLDALTTRYDERLDMKVEQLQTRAQQAEARAQQEAARAELAEQRVVLTETRAQQAEHRAALADARALGELRRFELAEVRSHEAAHRLQLAETRAAQAETDVNEKMEALEAVRQELQAVHEANHRHWQLLAETRKELHAVLEANHHHWQLAEARSRQINAMLSSTSWRLTAPLRRLKTSTLVLSPRSLKPKVRVMLQHMALYIGRRPRLKKVALTILSRLPAVKVYLAQIVNPTQLVSVRVQSPVSQVDLTHLTPRARRIYADLKTALERRRKGSV